MSTLIYIADPMCSWCYGFGPELTALLEGLPGLPTEIVTGGMRAYNTEPLNDQSRAELMAHWQQVADKTGLSFSTDTISQEGFIYNTEPACRAVVTARQLAPKATLSVFQAIQHAFYAEGLDVTRTEVLSEVAATALTKAGFPIGAAAFQTVFLSESAILGTHTDFNRTKEWGVDGFPTLVLEHNGSLDLVTAGFLQMPMLVEQMQTIIDKQKA